MPDTGWVAAGTGGDNAGVGTVAWSNPGNITADDATRATAAMTDPSTSHYLRASNFDFSAIPDGATIDGIEVRIQRHISAITCNDSSIRLFDASGTPAGNNKSAGAAWSTTPDTVAPFGGAADKWGLTPSAADVKDVDWGVGFSCVQSDNAATANVDLIEMRVTYTGGGPATNEHTHNMPSLFPLSVAA